MAGDAQKGGRNEFTDEIFPVVVVGALVLVVHCAQIYAEERLDALERDRLDLLIVLVGFAIFFTAYAFLHAVLVGTFGFSVMCLGVKGLWRAAVKRRDQT